MKINVQTYTLLTVLLLIMTLHETRGVRYYFSDISGDDSRSLSEAQHPDTPWKTINKLNQVFKLLQPGDSVLFKNDESYWGTIELTKSGSEDNPIYIGTYGKGKRAEITGLSQLLNWQNHTKNIYFTQLPSGLSELSVLIIENKPHPLGRHPNSTDPNKGYLPIESFESNNKLIISENLAQESDWSGGELVMRKNQWVIDRQPIIRQNNIELAYQSTSGYNPRKGFGFFIQNHIKALDEFGEWHYDKNTGKIYVYSENQDVNNLNILCSTKDNLLITLPNTRHIIINGLKFSGANKQNILIKGGDNIEIYNCEVVFSGTDGIHANNITRLAIENCLISHSYNTGIYSGPGNAYGVIKNNKIENTYMFPGMGLSGDNKGFAIFSVAEAEEISSNQITNSGYTGIGFRGNHTIVKNNYIDNYCLVKNDGAGIYTYNGSKNTEYVGRKVLNNIIINGRGTKEGTTLNTNMHFAPVEGIYMDDNATGVEIIGNTVADVSSKSLYLHNARNIVVKDNKFIGGQYQIYLKSDPLGGAIENIVITENKIICKEDTQIALAFLTDNFLPAGIGEINNNEYFFIDGNDFLFYSEYTNQEKEKVGRYFTLDTWSDHYHFDKNSRAKKIGQKKEEIKYLASRDLLSDNLSNEKSRFVCQGCELKWSGDHKHLNINFNKSPSLLKIKIGGVQLEKIYVLKLKSTFQGSSNLEFYLRHNMAPYTNLSHSRNMIFSESKNEYIIHLYPQISTSDAAIFINAYNPTFSINIEEMSLHEAKVNSTNENPSLLLLFNSTTEPKRFLLNKNVTDLDNHPYQSSVTLSPSHSIVLIEH